MSALNWKNFRYYRVGGTSIKSAIMQPETNAQRSIESVRRMIKNSICVWVGEELGIPSYTCHDGFSHGGFQKRCNDSVARFMKETADLECLMIIGSLYQFTDGRVFNVAFVILKGKIIGCVPKSYLPTYNVYYEGRHFDRGHNVNVEVNDPILGRFMMSKKQLFRINDLIVGVTICEDDYAMVPESQERSLAGANLVVNLSGSHAIVGKFDDKQRMFAAQSDQHINCNFYVSAGCSQSTVDYTMDGSIFAFEKGTLVLDAPRFQDEGTEAFVDFDIGKIMAKKGVNRTAGFAERPTGYVTHILQYTPAPIYQLSRKINKTPFIPSDPATLDERTKEIQQIQVHGIITKIRSMPLKDATPIVIGVSGGLDSLLALLMACEAKRILKRHVTEVIAITMPGAGTTDHTKSSAYTLMQQMGVTIHTVPINVLAQQFLDLAGHPQKTYNTAYESASAQVRTDVLLAFAREHNGLYLGTGDMSEIAQGWNTIFADQISFYDPNAGIPKTLIRHCCLYYAKQHSELMEVIMRIINTPISPELLPVDESGEQKQVTEDSLGDYTLIDFFMHHFLGDLRDPEEILYLAREAFSPKTIAGREIIEGSADYEKSPLNPQNKTFTPAYIKKFLENFVRRFYCSQYKRTICPPGPAVGTINLPSRGGLRFPDEARFEVICARIRELNENL